MRKLLDRLVALTHKSASHIPSQAAQTDIADRMIAEGNRAEKEGRLREACDRYRQAVDAAPGYAKAFLNLGIGLQAAGDAGGAMKSYEAALANDPQDVYVSYNLANLLFAQGDLARAEKLLCTALQLKPEFPEAGVMLANVYDAQGNLASAAAILERVLAQRPDYAGAWHNYADVLRQQERLVEAEKALRRTIRLDPNSQSALRMLGSILRGQSRLAEALDILGAARKLAPDRFDYESMELHSLTFLEQLSEEALFAKHKAFGARLEKAFPPRFAPFRNDRDPERRLRIGYMSSDFSLHPVALFSVPVFERHDRSAFEIYCYSTSSNTDKITDQLRALADVWREAASMPDPELADLISRDGIDILVDLTGHAGVIRLGVFAEQPAPVQVTWLGYLNTTGLTRIQYRLCDACTDPPGATEHLYTETLVRLSHSQWCYRPFLTVDHAIAPPFKRNGYITFGSFNHMAKLSVTTRKLWSDILTLLPDSRLVVMGVPEGQARDRLLQDFREAGIAVSRITIVPYVLLDEYFRWFNAVDMALDTTPYSGGTTTCDTLWMGVPVITVPGPRSVSRSTASILTTVGLHDWIASTLEDYVRLALHFAREGALITEMRKSLRQRMRESPIMDETRFVHDIEGAYRRMWRTWCDSTAA